LLHLVDGTVEHAGEAYKTVRAELAAYGHGLIDKPEVVALNKADALTPDQIKQQVARLKRAAKTTPLIMSGATGQGLPEVVRALQAAIDQAATPARERSPSA
jgi:GTPase